MFNEISHQDKIILPDLSFWACHGVLPQEHEQKHIRLFVHDFPGDKPVGDQPGHAVFLQRDTENQCADADDRGGISEGISHNCGGRGDSCKGQQTD